jgi:uncharacterized protein
VKYLILLLVLVVAAAWLWRGRRRDRSASGPAERPAQGAATMVACAHCGVHLPQPEALFDAAGRPYCSDAHRVAGPRPAP